MFGTYFFSFFLSEKRRNKKIIYGLIFAVCAVLTYFTYSRGPILGLFLGVLLVGILEGGKRMLLYSAIGLVLLAGAIFALDLASGGKLSSRIIDSSASSPIEGLYTKDDGVEVRAEGKVVTLSVEGIGDEEYILPFSFEAKAFVSRDDDYSYINLLLDDEFFQFASTDDGYMYVNKAGKMDVIEDVPHVDLPLDLSLGSGRLYIWSRTLPLLSGHIFLGSGQDTYAEVFPQDDYFGKLVYAQRTDRIIEGAHNNYLTMWVQAGGAGTVCFVLFVCFYIRKYIKGFKDIRTSPEEGADYALPQTMGKASFAASLIFIISGFTNDSTLFTTPYFYIFTGIALASLYMKGD